MPPPPPPPPSSPPAAAQQQQQRQPEAQLGHASTPALSAPPSSPPPSPPPSAPTPTLAEPTIPQLLWRRALRAPLVGPLLARAAFRSLLALAAAFLALNAALGAALRPALNAWVLPRVCSVISGATMREVRVYGVGKEGGEEGADRATGAAAASGAGGTSGERGRRRAATGSATNATAANRRVGVVRCDPLLGLLGGSGGSYSSGSSTATARGGAARSPSSSAAALLLLGGTRNDIGGPASLLPALLTIEGVSIGPGPAEKTHIRARELSVRLRPLSSLREGRLVLELLVRQPLVTAAQSANLSWLGFPQDTAPLSSRQWVPGLAAAEHLQQLLLLGGQGQQQQQQQQQGQQQQQHEADALSPSPSAAAASIPEPTALVAGPVRAPAAAANATKPTTTTAPAAVPANPSRPPPARLAAVRVREGELRLQAHGEPLPRRVAAVAVDALLGQNYETLELSGSGLAVPRDPRSDKLTTVSPHAKRHLRFVTPGALWPGERARVFTNDNTPGSGLREALALERQQQQQGQQMQQGRPPGSSAAPVIISPAADSIAAAAPQAPSLAALFAPVQTAGREGGGGAPPVSGGAGSSTNAVGGGGGGGRKLPLKFHYLRAHPDGGRAAAHAMLAAEEAAFFELGVLDVRDAHAALAAAGEGEDEGEGEGERGEREGEGASGASAAAAAAAAAAVVDRSPLALAEMRRLRDENARVVDSARMMDSPDGGDGGGAGRLWALLAGPRSPVGAALRRPLVPLPGEGPLPNAAPSSRPAPTETPPLLAPAPLRVRITYRWPRSHPPPRDDSSDLRVSLWARGLDARLAERLVELPMDVHRGAITGDLHVALRDPGAGAQGQGQAHGAGGDGAAAAAAPPPACCSPAAVEAAAEEALRHSPWPFAAPSSSPSPSVSPSLAAAALAAALAPPPPPSGPTPGPPFPTITGRLDIRGADFHFWDATDDVLGARLAVELSGDRAHLLRAEGRFGSVPLRVSGDLDLDALRGGQYRLQAVVGGGGGDDAAAARAEGEEGGGEGGEGGEGGGAPAPAPLAYGACAEANALRATLGVRPIPFALAGAVCGELHVTGPLEKPVFSGRASLVRPPAPMLARVEPSPARDALLADAGAAGAYDRVPFLPGGTGAVFTLDTATETFLLHSATASPCGGGTVAASGRVWVAPRAEDDPRALAVQAVGEGIGAAAVARAYGLGGATGAGPPALAASLGRLSVRGALTGAHTAPVVVFEAVSSAAPPPLSAAAGAAPLNGDGGGGGSSSGAGAPAASADASRQQQQQNQQGNASTTTTATAAAAVTAAGVLSPAAVRLQARGQGFDARLSAATSNPRLARARAADTQAEATANGAPRVDAFSVEAGVANLDVLALARAEQAMQEAWQRWAAVAAAETAGAAAASGAGADGAATAAPTPAATVPPAELFEPPAAPPPPLDPVDGLPVRMRVSGRVRASASLVADAGGGGAGEGAGGGAGGGGPAAAFSATASGAPPSPRAPSSNFEYRGPFCLESLRLNGLTLVSPARRGGVGGAWAPGATPAAAAFAGGGGAVGELSLTAPRLLVRAGSSGGGAPPPAAGSAYPRAGGAASRPSASSPAAPPDAQLELDLALPAAATRAALMVRAQRAPSTALAAAPPGPTAALRTATSTRSTRTTTTARPCAAPPPATRCCAAAHCTCRRRSTARARRRRRRPSTCRWTRWSSGPCAGCCAQRPPTSTWTRARAGAPSRWRSRGWAAWPAASSRRARGGRAASCGSRRRCWCSGGG